MRPSSSAGILLVLTVLALLAFYLGYFRHLDMSMTKTRDDVFFESVDLSVVGVPSLGQTVELVFRVKTPDLPVETWDRILSGKGGAIGMEIVLPKGFELVNGGLSWEGYVGPNAIKEIRVNIRAVEKGDWVIGAWAGPILNVKFDRANLYVSVLEDTAIVSNVPLPMPTQTPISGSRTDNSTSTSSVEASGSAHIICEDSTCGLLPPWLRQNKSQAYTQPRLRIESSGIKLLSYPP